MRGGRRLGRRRWVWEGEREMEGFGGSWVESVGFGEKGWIQWVMVQRSNVWEPWERNWEWKRGREEGGNGVLGVWKEDWRFWENVGKEGAMEKKHGSLQEQSSWLSIWGREICHYSQGMHFYNHTRPWYVVYTLKYPILIRYDTNMRIEIYKLYKKNYINWL